jgi:oxygen-dependent protoporphyrinogen oxidase
VTRRVAVVGAGPAGLTAAYRLVERGLHVDVLEREAEAGGRTHTEHHGDGHWVDTGAGWLASFYPSTLALLDEIGQRHRLSPMPLRGGGDLLLDGRLVPTPNSVGRILGSSLLGPLDKGRFFVAMARLFATQRGDLAIDLDHDGETALDALAGFGTAARERIVRPNFEGPFFARLEQMSGALVRSWLRVLSVGTFFHVAGGMDAPWRALADLLGARTGVTVTGVETTRDGGAAVHIDGSADRYDAVVLAIPAPVAADLLTPDDRPAILSEIGYVPHVRLYAARRGAGPARSGIHVFPNDLVATVELGAGRFGAWGQVPDEWAWALACAPAASSGPLLDAPAEEVQERIWAEARRIDPRVFPLDRADVVQLIRWPHAVPDVRPGYHARLDAFHQRPPVFFAGDWLVQPCVEGAVRSGERAAELVSGALR